MDECCQFTCTHSRDCAWVKEQRTCPGCGCVRHGLDNNHNANCRYRPLTYEEYCGEQYGGVIVRPTCCYSD